MTFAYGVIFLSALIFNLLVKIEMKFLPGMYHMLNYSYAQFECNQSIHSQIIEHIISVVLAVVLSVHHDTHIKSVTPTLKLTHLNKSKLMLTITGYRLNSIA